MKVKELIEKLKDLDQELLIVIDDADEGSQLHIRDVFINKDSISLAGYYDDRFCPGTTDKEK